MTDENFKIFKDPVWEIPGLNWSKLTLKQARQHKTFLQQEIQRWLQDTDYLMNLRLTNLIPVPVEEWQENNPGAKVFHFFLLKLSLKIDLQVVDFLKNDQF